ncbi:MAG TPA: HNH endonuclease [Clostridium sp.]|uniref:HNH endonuclease n=1 Tax=Clostridium sp. TaxID=1506 RepID=UPI002F942C70
MKLCENKGFNATESYINVILANATGNKHSPTYKKYFERIGKGEYELLDVYREHESFYWLNVDTKGYEWSFSDLKVGRSQEYSNLSEEGSKRKNQSCFDDIKIGDKVVAYEIGEISGITAICEVINKKYENEEIIVEFRKEIDFEEFLNLDEMRANKELEGCKVVGFHRGTIFKIEKEHFYIIKKMLEEINIQLNSISEFDKAVNESLRLSVEERRKRLESKKNSISEKINTVSSGYRRNPDVVAEALERAQGRCGKCRKEGPFKRVSDGTIYLEVHHIIRLADGGEDTVENAIAVCPNCHRELHFG